MRPIRSAIRSYLLRMVGGMAWVACLHLEFRVLEFGGHYLAGVAKTEG